MSMKGRKVRIVGDSVEGIIQQVAWGRGGDSCRVLIEGVDGRLHIASAVSIEMLDRLLFEEPIPKVFEDLLGEVMAHIEVLDTPPASRRSWNASRERLRIKAHVARNHIRKVNGKDPIPFVGPK